MGPRGGVGGGGVVVRVGRERGGSRARQRYLCVGRVPLNLRQRARCPGRGPGWPLALGRRPGPASPGPGPDPRPRWRPGRLSHYAVLMARTFHVAGLGSTAGASLMVGRLRGKLALWVMVFLKARTGDGAAPLVGT